MDQEGKYYKPEGQRQQISSWHIEFNKLYAICHPCHNREKQLSYSVIIKIMTEAPLESNVQTENLIQKNLTIETPKGPVEVSERIWGNGPIQLIALHGWTEGGSEEMVPFAELFSPSKYTVYMPDFPGFRESPDPQSSWDIRNYAEFISAYTKSHQNTSGKPINILGHSFGGRVSIVFASQNPQAVNKLILIDSAGIKHPLPLKDQIRLNTYKFARNKLSKSGFKDLSDKLRGWYVKRYGSSDFQKTSGVMRETFIKVVNQDLKSEAQKIKAPTLLIWGSKDDQTPLSDGKKLEQLIPDAGLVVWEGAGHFSYLDRPIDTVKVIDYFLTN